jgi:hypothetical protein
MAAKGSAKGTLGDVGKLGSFNGTMLASIARPAFPRAVLYAFSLTRPRNFPTRGATGGQ